MKDSRRLAESRTIRISTLVCCGIVLSFLLWAGTAPLAEGVVASGQITVASKRQTIQHLEGGIISELLVAEGDTVVAGQPMLLVADLSTMAQRDQAAYQLADGQASVARLSALLNAEMVDSGALFAIEFESGTPLAQSVADEIKQRHYQLFQQQRDALAAQLAVLEARRAGLSEKAAGAAEQLMINNDAVEILNAEIARQTELLERKLVRADELARLRSERNQALQNQRRLKSEQALAEAQAQETYSEAQRAQVDAREEYAAALTKARAEVLRDQESLMALQDMVDRMWVHAPLDGEILNLKFSTPGGVVKPGESILEIVPSQASKIATVNVRPIDRDGVSVGLVVDARLASSDGWQSTVYSGAVRSISADLKTSPDGTVSFYEAQIALTSLKSHRDAGQPLPGMPVETFIYSGRNRTFLSYLTEPVLTTVRRGAIE